VNTDHPRPRIERVATVEVFGYFAALLIIANLVTPSGSLAQLPISFYLKEQLHLGPKALANFGLITGVPVYGACLFGLVRDRWSPWALGDRGFFLLFAPIAAIAYVFVAFRHDTYGQILLGILIAMFVYRLIGPAVGGLTATVGQRLTMTGRLSSLVQFVGNVVAALVAFASGWVSQHLSYQAIFLLLAGFSICLALLGLAHPQAVFGPARAERGPPKHLLQDIARLVRHRPLWPAVLINLTWAFGPGQGTPLFYQLTNVAKLNHLQVGIYNMIGALTFVPGLAAYGFLCRKVSPKKLLIIATVIAIPQMIPLTYIHTVAQAYGASTFVGMVGGMAAASYYDLLLRSCPKGLEGTTVELSVTGNVITGNFGNLWGAILYEHGGFALCNWITTAAYALILPMILLVPKETLARRDAEE